MRCGFAAATFAAVLTSGPLSASAQQWYDAPPPRGYYDPYDEPGDVRAIPPRRAGRFYEDEYDRTYERRLRRDERGRRFFDDDAEGREIERGNEAPVRRAAPAPAPRRATGLEPAPAVGTSGGSRPYIRPVAPPRVAFSGRYAPGSIVIDTSARKLYYVIGPMSAYAYPIGVGRDGFSWSGSEKVSRIADWPDWYPPAEMRKRRPDLPEKMTGGLRNPLGAKAIYLGNTLYRIHGTNDPKSIGRAESSGCFRMMNQHVLHLASLVKVGTPVTVLRSAKSNRVATSARQSDENDDEPASRDWRPRDDRRYVDPYEDDWRWR